MGTKKSRFTSLISRFGISWTTRPTALGGVLTRAEGRLREGRTAIWCPEGDLEGIQGQRIVGILRGVMADLERDMAVERAPLTPIDLDSTPAVRISSAISTEL